MRGRATVTRRTLPFARAAFPLSLLLAAAPAAAATCDVTPQGVGFGPYDPLDAAALDGVGNISIRCDSAVPFTLSLDPGGGSYADRRMSGPGGSLHYNLYVDASRTIVWGDGSGGTTTVSGSGPTAEVPIYGRMSARQNAGAGAYADTIIVTISY
jgi:spore coat protein U-like protein